jgi:DNA-directed RNA polymerase specialized sigma24 family protein
MIAPLTQTGEIDKRFKRQALTAEQQQLVLSCVDWVPKWVHVVLSKAAIRAFGYEDCVAEAWEIVVRAAGLWRAEMGATFRYFAMNGVKKYLPVQVARKNYRNRKVWCEMPLLPPSNSGDEEQVCDKLADHRTRDPNPLLHAWCDDSARELRRHCFWIDRIIIYLHFVECWSLDEISKVFNLSRERIRQLEMRGRKAIEQARLMAQVRLQLAGRG